MKVRLIIEGNVQGAGYRTIVRQVARGFGIKGMVRNSENGSVEIFCETDRETLEKFKKMIDIKSPPEDLFGVNVENIDEYDEDSKNYVNPPEKFEYFHIDYLNEDLLKTSVERAEIGIFAFKGMHKDLKKGQDQMLDKQDETTAAIKGLDKKQDKMIEKQDETIEVIGTRFDTMDSKYSDISETMKEMKNLFEKLVDYIIKKEK